MIIVYVLYYSYKIKNDEPDTEIVGVYPSEEELLKAKQRYIENNLPYIIPGNLCYHETVMYTN